MADSFQAAAVPRSGKSDLHALRTLSPYLWPAGEFGMNARVIAALLCLAVAKVANVYIPIFYKRAVDALSGPADLALVLPVGAILAYGLARVDRKSTRLNSSH